MDAYLAVFKYKLKSSIPGIWTVFQKADISAGILRYSKDVKYAEYALRHLLNTHSLHSFILSITATEWQSWYSSSAIMMIPENVRIYPMDHS